MNKRHVIITAAVTSVIVFVFTSLFYTGTSIGRRLFTIGAESSTGKNYSKFIEIEELLEENYMGEINQEEMLENAFSAYVGTLKDPYTSYLDKEFYAQINESLGGGYSGIGIEISADEENRICVEVVKEGSPAQKGGMKPGDIIVKIDSEEFDASRMNEAISKIKKGEIGEKILITVEREGQIIDLEVVREPINMEYVTSRLIEPSIGYIRVKTFGDKTSEDFATALESLEKEEMKGLIIDLRSNRGGILEEVVAMTDLLIPEGVITTVKGKTGDVQVYESDENEVSVPMCILVNSESASASEIMAGALKDFNKAVLVGKKTFGKGVVQGMYDFDDGTGLRITVAKYYTPLGECIHQKGIMPDVEVDLPEGVQMSSFTDVTENDTQLEKALELLTSQV